MPRTFKSSYRFKRAFSSGGILFREEAKGPLVALISRAGGKIWCLPKGLVEKGETAQETALREVQEETGLTGKIIQKVGDVTYWFVAPEEKARIFKKVSFFLLQYTGGDPQEHDLEVDEVAWFPIDEAMARLTYANERKLVGKARQILK